MSGVHPLKQILRESRPHWDHPGTPVHVREELQKVIDCGTIALGAEVFASKSQSKVVFHTCKSRFCTSCGHRATEAWQEEMEAILPDVPYVGITLTMPMEFRSILRQNRCILYGIPAMGAEAIQQWAKARYGVRLIVIVVQQTFGGLLNFSPHLHVMVSAGGLQQSTNVWIHRLKYDQLELMRAWRYAVIAFLAEAHKRTLLKSDLPDAWFRTTLATQYARKWNVFIGRPGSKKYQLKHDGRYIRRPPVAQHRITRIGAYELEYLTKDTRNKQVAAKRYTNVEFIETLIQHVPDRGRHAMRYFGLLSPRSKARIWSAVFVLLHQRKQERLERLSWRWLLLKSFGVDPLMDCRGHLMEWVGRWPPKIVIL